MARAKASRTRTVRRPRQPHLRALDKIERECIPGLVNVLREDGPEAVRYFLWDVTGRHHHSQA